jgi:hypothetical protein
MEYVRISASPFNGDSGAWTKGNIPHAAAAVPAPNMYSESGSVHYVYLAAAAYQLPAITANGFLRINISQAQLIYWNAGAPGANIVGVAPAQKNVSVRLLSSTGAVSYNFGAYPLGAAGNLTLSMNATVGDRLEITPSVNNSTFRIDVLDFSVNDLGAILGPALVMDVPGFLVDHPGPLYEDALRAYSKRVEPSLLLVMEYVQYLNNTVGLNVEPPATITALVPQPYNLVNWAVATGDRAALRQQWSVFFRFLLTMRSLLMDDLGFLRDWRASDV